MSASWGWVFAVGISAAFAVACEDPGKEKAEQCKAALEDSERLLKGQELARAREEQTRAAKVCPPTHQDQVANLDQRITAVEKTMADLRKAQDEKEKAAKEKKKSREHGDPPVIGAHSKETGATGDCKTYVDCLCGLADTYRYHTGIDAHRDVCKDAKKVLAGKNAQQGCAKLLKELGDQDDSWKSPYESEGVAIPSMCP